MSANGTENIYVQCNAIRKFQRFVNRTGHLQTVSIRKYPGPATNSNASYKSNVKYAEPMYQCAEPRMPAGIKEISSSTGFSSITVSRRVSATNVYVQIYHPSFPHLTAWL